MSLKIGNLDIASIKVGSADCKVYIGNELLYSSEPPFKNYLRTIAVTNGKIGFEINKSVAPTEFTSFSYSLDSGETWTTVNNSAYTIVQVNLDVVAGDVIYWKGDAIRLSIGSSTNQYSRFVATASFDVEGNVMSMLYGDNFEGQTSLAGKDYAFCSLFKECSNIINAENLVLPSTTLTEGCYNAMFQGCTMLTTAPELPATTLAQGCYRSMFSNCTSLTTAPELSATTLASHCYRNMFYNCTSLTTAPELSATTLAYCCYYYMFRGCTSLNYIKCLATDISATDCTYGWLNNVSPTGTFTKAASMTSWPRGVNGIPNNWTIQDAT